MKAPDHDHVVVQSEPLKNPKYRRPLIIDHFSKTVFPNKKFRVVYTYAFPATSADHRPATREESLLDVMRVIGK